MYSNNVKLLFCSIFRYSYNKGPSRLSRYTSYSLSLAGIESRFIINLVLLSVNSLIDFPFLP